MIPSSYNGLMNAYQIEQEEFLSWLNQKNIEYDEKQITKTDDWSFISKRIKAELANAIWGKDYYYKALIESDQQVIRAIAQFDAASELLIKK